MLISRTFLKLSFAIIFIAVKAINAPATAQFTSKNGISAVVTTERARAELVAHAPQGVAAGLDDKITPSAALAHVLEEFWRFWSAHDADLDAARGRDGG